MTLHRGEIEVGVRELHDKLSEHLDRVERGTAVVVTRRGKRIARLTAMDDQDPLAELEARGLVRRPTRSRGPLSQPVVADGSVSDLVAEQRR